jgi:hypothetical protein
MLEYLLIESSHKTPADTFAKLTLSSRDIKVIETDQEVCGEFHSLIK